MNIVKLQNWNRTELSTRRYVFTDYCGVKQYGYSYPQRLNVSFNISITTTKLWESNYSEYQQYLFNRICEYKDNNVTSIGYRKISKIFNEEGLRTSRGKIFKNTHIHSIFKKGKIREERNNRKDIVEISQVTIEELKKNIFD